MASSRVRAAGVSLQHLADMAIGTPVVGTVNFPALHTLLHAIIRHLHIQDVSAVLLGETRSCPPSGEADGREPGMEKRPAGEADGREPGMEKRPAGEADGREPGMEKRPAGEADGREPGMEKRLAAVEDGWKMLQLSGRLEVTEEGVSKAMAVLQDLMLEVNTLKESQREVQNQMQSVAEAALLETNLQLEQRHDDVKRELEMESLQIEMELMKTRMKELEAKFEVFHKTLANHPETSNQPSDDDSRMSGPTHVADGPILDSSHTLLPQTQGSSKAEDSVHPVETPHITENGITMSTLEDNPIEMSGQQHETNLTYLEIPTPQNTGTNLSMTGMGTSAASGLAEGTLALPTGVTTKVDALERDKAGHTEPGHLQTNTDNLQETPSNVSKEMQDVRRGPDKLDQLQKAIEPVGTSQNNDHKLPEASLNEENPTMERSAADKPQCLQNQDGELISHIQETMSQLQEECERLTRTTGSLIQDHEQKQRHIDILYQTMENLDMRKLDKDIIGLQDDAKADERTLESQVSGAHFDATTDQLSRMVQELLGKVNAQEQDWQRLLERINAEMQNKLDRIELEPLKNILEECWRDLRRQLQEHPPQYETDKAAGIRKQLVRFHCISCDRPVNMVAPGSEVLTIPNIPGLPAHHSNRPYTVYELDQIRQQSRSDRFPQLNDFGYMSSSRHCGGLHTLTFPQRRYARLQASPPCTGQKEDFVGGLKEELFILGQDGHIYRGRRDNHLPSIRTKGGKGSTVAYQKICDCNVKGEDNFCGCSSDIHYGLSKSHLKSARGSELPLPSVKDNQQSTCYQSTKAT